MSDLAISHGSSAVLSVGLAPGLTNLLVRACTSTMDEPHAARIEIMLGLGDTHGPAALEWTLRQFTAPSTHRAPLETIVFGERPNPTPALPLDFADQHVVRRTLGVKHARTVLAFHPPWQSRAVLRLLQLITSHPPLVRLAKILMSYLSFGSDRVSLVAEVQGKRGGDIVNVRATMEGRREANITAFVAALLVDHVRQTGVKPGVWHLEQIMSIEELIPALRGRDIVVQLPVTDPRPSAETAEAFLTQNRST